jgi:hypothetical protein
VVSRWEGALDFQALNERVGLRSNASSRKLQA